MERSDLNSDACIAELERLRTKGADFLVIPATARWWLQHYTQFGEYLQVRYGALRSEQRRLHRGAGAAAYEGRRLPGDPCDRALVAAALHTVWRVPPGPLWSAQI